MIPPPPHLFAWIILNENVYCCSIFRSDGLFFHNHFTILFCLFFTDNLHPLSSIELLKALPTIWTYLVYVSLFFCAYPFFLPSVSINLIFFLYNKIWLEATHIITFLLLRSTTIEQCRISFYVPVTATLVIWVNRRKQARSFYYFTNTTAYHNTGIITAYITSSYMH